jgi:hypothetical protein
MSEGASERISVELTPSEARLVIAALNQFEPFWPPGMDDLDRADLLAGVREAIDHVTDSLGGRSIVAPR